MKAVLALLASCIVAFSLQAPKPVEPLKVAPLEYFAKHCQRCHGENGLNYLSNFADGKSDDDLLAKLKSMAEGPGQSPLEPDDLAIQLAFHRSISAKAPFITWTAHEGNKISGEVTGDAKLIVTPELPIKLEDGAWSIELPANTKVDDIVLTATLKDQSSILSLKERAVSEIQPQKK